ncbi:MAG TPA: hypothetical protein VGS58_19190, partial [Candidatus Sulfopaludibacter sp.]|nr:hypothetical protein [Candidatus Sulfopaludibacter sp.]
MRSSRFLRFWLAAAISISVYWAWAQQAPKAPAQTPAATPQEGPAKFQATAQLVVETVSVTDKSGKPIEGLTAKDFTITEDNVPQTISFCEYQKMVDTAPAAPPPVAEDKPAAEKPKVEAVTSIQISP